MIITDNVNTFTDLYAQETAEPVWNSNQVTTIGGVVKNQADSQRLQISIQCRLTQAELKSLSDILTNFSQALYYTPSRVLYDKSTASKIEVTVDPPRIESRAYNGGLIFIVNLTLHEVIG